MTISICILAAFVIGFLLGDRRGVKQCNAILDSNMKVLLKAIGDEPPEAGDIASDDHDGARPTVH